MANSLPPPPVNDVPGSFTWMEWYRQLRDYVSTSGSVPWYIINFAGSNITDIALRDHNNLQGIQGGTTGEYYHLTLPEHTKVVNNEFPDLQVGDVAGGNYTNIGTDGTITLYGTATVWDDLRVEPNIKTAGSNDPTFTKWFDNGAGSRGVYLWNFTNAATANEKEVYFTVQLPHSWAGTAITPHVHWLPSIAGAGQRPVWGLEYSWADIGTAFGNTTIAYTNALVPNDTNLVQYRSYVSDFPAITPSASQDGISSVMICRLFRYSGNASDTYTGTCGLMSVDFHYELNTIGSATITTK